MRKRFLGLTALAALILACEPPAQSAAKNPGAPKPVAPAVTTNAPTTVSEDAIETEPEHEETDSKETYGERDSTPDPFDSEDAKRARAALESQLARDQFASTDTRRPYGTACQTIEVNPPDRYQKSGIRVAFVRPRVIGASFEMSRAYTLSAEITRLATFEQDAGGQWRGSIGVSRDTLLYRVVTPESIVNWSVCGMPGHDNGYNRDYSHQLMTPWLPLNAGDTTAFKVTWNSNATWSKLSRLADSVAKLPVDAVVEGNPEPKMPMVINDVCPGEGCSFGEWLTCDTIRVLTEPKVDARTAYILKRNDRFTAVTGDVRITQAAKLVFTRPVKIRGEGVTYNFTPADTLYPLQYGGEGSGMWYFRGKEGGGDFFFSDGLGDDLKGKQGDGYVVVRPIVSAWWVKARSKEGKEGWFVPGGKIFGMSPHYEETPKSCPQ